MCPQLYQNKINDEALAINSADKKVLNKKHGNESLVEPVPEATGRGAGAVRATGVQASYSPRLILSSIEWL